MFFSVYVCENTAILTFSLIQFISDANDILFKYKRCSHKINMQIEHNTNMVMFHCTVIENYFNISKKVWFFEYYMVIIMVRTWSNRHSGFLWFDLAGSRLWPHNTKRMIHSKKKLLIQSTLRFQSGSCINSSVFKNSQ